MAGCHKTIASIVSRTANNEHPFAIRDWVRFVNAYGNTQASQLHQLVHTELVLVEQFLIDSDSFLLTGQLRISEDAF